MPIEGTENTGNAATAETQTTSDATAQNTEAATTGAGTEAAQQTQAQTEPTFTQEQVNAMIAKRLPSAVKAELKKMSDDEEGKPNVDELQRQLSEKDTRIRSFEARESVEEFINDGRNKLNVKSENIRGIQEIVIPRLEYDDTGKPTNLKDAIESAKVIAPALFANQQSNINAANGRNSAPSATNMNDFIRQAAGIGN